MLTRSSRRTISPLVNRPIFGIHLYDVAQANLLILAKSPQRLNVFIVGGENFHDQQGRIEYDPVRLPERPFHHEHVRHTISCLRDAGAAFGTHCNLKPLLEGRQ